MAIGQVPAYSLAERDRRWALARELIGRRARGGPARVPRAGAPTRARCVLTNDQPGSIVIFCRDADPVMLVDTPVMVANQLASRRRGEPGWIAAHNVRGTRHPGGEVGVLRAHGLLQAAIGVLGIDPLPRSLQQVVPAMPNALWAALLQALPQAHLVGVCEPFRARAATQSAEEQAVLAYAAPPTAHRPPPTVHCWRLARSARDGGDLVSPQAYQAYQAYQACRARRCTTGRPVRPGRWSRAVRLSADGDACAASRAGARRGGPGCPRRSGGST